MGKRVREIHCVECDRKVRPIKIHGSTAYPHRPDLSHLKFYQCTDCMNFVGTHKGTWRPLGVIANKELKSLRIEIHGIIDQLWRDGSRTRNSIYKAISTFLGEEYHTGKIASVDVGKEVIEFCKTKL
jgi:hypothetical protein